MKYELTQKQLDGLRLLGISPVESESKKWEPKEGDYMPSNLLDGIQSTGAFTNSASVPSGLERDTKEQAESLRKLLRRTARLHALVCELNGEVEFVNNVETYYVYHNNNETWRSSYATFHYSPGRVHMTKECAQTICEMLNSGKVSLDE